MIISLIDGSLGGEDGNTSRFIRPLLDLIRSRAQLREFRLASSAPDANLLEQVLRESDGYVFATGTYWDSWGSPLQAFFENATRFEASDLWLGKPAAAVVTMHSVGGKEVLSRIQGVLSTLGLLIPPMSAMTYSLASHIASRTEDPSLRAFREDFWQAEDLQVIGHNLLEAAAGGRAWRSWSVDREDASRPWL